jgi:hypothetical protein
VIPPKIDDFIVTLYVPVAAYFDTDRRDYRLHKKAIIEERRRWVADRLGRYDGFTRSTQEGAWHDRVEQVDVYRICVHANRFDAATWNQLAHDIKVRYDEGTVLWQASPCMMNLI